MDDDNFIEANMVHCQHDKRPGNLIEHISDYDGTRRSEQACYIIEKFNPENAKDMAAIVYGNLQSTVAGNPMHDYYPMLWEDKKLVDFCYNESQKSENHHWSGKQDAKYGGAQFIKDTNKKKMEDHLIFMKSCVGHIDTIDIYADVWELSPTLQHRYPTNKTWGDKFKNTHIHTGEENEPFEGWHDFKDESENHLLDIGEFMEKL